MTYLLLSDHYWSLSLIINLMRVLKQDIHFFIIIRHKNGKEKNLIREIKWNVFYLNRSCFVHIRIQASENREKNI